MNVLHCFAVAVLVVIQIGLSEERLDEAVDCHKLILNRGKWTCCRRWKYERMTDSCVPICRTPCKKNAVCSAPNVCTCENGYTKGENDSCDPICDDCQHGDCINPGECKCRDGFMMFNGKCEPQCNESCVNGFCTAPNICTCHDGFQKSDKRANECVKPCETACENGECDLMTGQCRCKIGYYIINNKCEPQCSEPCFNGFCTAPNTCACHDGFQKSDKKTNECIMPCKTACENGECDFKTGQCRCNIGYNLTNNNCEPLCSKPCFNGFCIGPNTCACNDGFQKSDKTANECIKPCIPDCENGECDSKTGECVCSLGYEWNRKSSICEPGPMVNCSSCAYNCTDDGCNCINGSICFLPPPEASETQMAGLRPVWIGGGLVALLLLVLVVLVMQQISRRKKDYITNEEKKGEIGSVLYARPNTLLQQRPEHAKNENEETEIMIRNQELPIA